MIPMRPAVLSAVLVAAVVSVSPVLADASPSPKSPLPFIEDDYAGALKQARAKNVPIFVENWAPW